MGPGENCLIVLISAIILINFTHLFTYLTVCTSIRTQKCTRKRGSCFSEVKIKEKIEIKKEKRKKKRGREKRKREKYKTGKKKREEKHDN